MPPLDNAKEELYAQSRSKGMTQVDSYVAAGFEEDDAHASRYEAGNGRIEKRVKELQQTAAERCGIDIEWWITETKGLYEKCLTDNELPTARGSLDMLGKNLGVYEEHNKQGKSDNNINLGSELVKHLGKMGVDVE